MSPAPGTRIEGVGVPEQPAGGGPVAWSVGSFRMIEQRQRHPDDDAAVLVLASDVPLACRAVPGLLAAAVMAWQPARERM